MLYIIKDLSVDQVLFALETEKRAENWIKTRGYEEIDRRPGNYGDIIIYVV